MQSEGEGETMSVDAKFVKQEGRAPVASKSISGWVLEVYRVGRRHQFQGLMTEPDTGATYQTLRFGGPRDGRARDGDCEARRRGELGPAGRPGRRDVMNRHDSDRCHDELQETTMKHETPRKSFRLSPKTVRRVKLIQRYHENSSPRTATRIVEEGVRLVYEKLPEYFRTEEENDGS
jgi:hypothetical protein